MATFESRKWAQLGSIKLLKCLIQGVCEIYCCCWICQSLCDTYFRGLVYIRIFDVKQFTFTYCSQVDHFCLMFSHQWTRQQQPAYVVLISTDLFFLCNKNVNVGLCREVMPDLARFTWGYFYISKSRDFTINDITRTISLPTWKINCGQSTSSLGISTLVQFWVTVITQRNCVISSDIFGYKYYFVRSRSTVYIIVGSQNRHH